MSYNSAIATAEGLDASSKALINDSIQIMNRVNSISEIGNRNKIYCNR